MERQDWLDAKIDKEGIDKLVSTYAPHWDIWGSCQYQTAAGFCRLVVDARRTLSWEEAGEALGFRLTHSGVREDALANLRAEIVSDSKDCPWREEPNVENIQSISGAFEFLRKSAGDLWGAAPFVAKACFKDLEVEAQDSPGFGPKLNVLVQSENYRVGLFCALLLDHKLVGDETPFIGFDT